MKTERRHELQKNQLADWLGVKLVWCEQNARLLAGIGLSVIVVAGVFAYYEHSRSERILAAWSNYFGAVESRDDAVRDKSLEQLARTENSTLPGQMADLLLADIALNDGINQLSTDRAAGEKRLNEAKTRYIEARDSASDKYLKERAVLGLARFYESMGLLEEAIKEYRSLADAAGGLYQAEAARKLDYLAKPSTIQFAKAYRERKEPIKPVGAKLFDVDELNKLPKSEATFPGGSATSSSPATTPSASPSPSPTSSSTAKP